MGGPATLGFELSSDHVVLRGGHTSRLKAAMLPPCPRLSSPTPVTPGVFFNVDIGGSKLAELSYNCLQILYPKLQNFCALYTGAKSLDPPLENLPVSKDVLCAPLLRT